MILLDSEGFYGDNIEESYDAKLFTAVSLASSYLLYNSIKLVDQAAVDYLEILARRAQLFQVKNVIHGVSKQDEHRSPLEGLFHYESYTL